MTNTTPIRIEEITTTQMHHARIKKATKLSSMLEAEYPAISLTALLDMDANRVVGFTAVATGEDGPVTLHEGEEIPTLADLMDACEEHGIDPEEGAEEERRAGGSVVAETYRTKYAEASSNGQTCGDWLAETLTTWCHSPDGFSIADFRAVIDANGVDQTGKWAKLPESGQKGWVGRYRMNGRQALEKTVAWYGFVRDAQGNAHEVPAMALDALRSKHAKWIEKQEKLEAAMKQNETA